MRVERNSPARAQTHAAASCDPQTVVNFWEIFPKLTLTCVLRSSTHHFGCAGFVELRGGTGMQGWYAIWWPNTVRPVHDRRLLQPSC
jgi:hypothetical protein